ncbi:(Fe-S)-binding protein [Methylobacter tundripaludum]|uniref:(Fe-S)-binding protein n=1 Tax=Methylobacter tundripaludum TaxID=173365 RepID=UPI0004DF1891|nr:(Fe-S)-binding protein [Methylobacter tundripaludum]
MFDFMDMSYDEPGEPLGSGPYIPDAGECMRCGVCVSSCPTFRLFQVDEETPRRRIRTISKILVENLPISADERRHLDNCIQCRACETVCPSRMAYGQLFDQAQAQLKVNPGWLAKLAFRLIEKKDWLRRLMPLPAIYLKSGLQKPLRSTGLLKKLHLAEAEALLGKPALQAMAVSYPASVMKRGRVALFTGCISEYFDRETLLAAIKLLNAIGYEVLVPQQQGCCGAIHQHNGQSAAGLIDNSISVFNALDVDAVLHTATGCGAMLSEYQNDDEAGQQFRQRLCDISDFLLEHWPDDLQLTASKLKVAVHEPCSQRNVLKNQQTVYALLQKIPGLSITALDDNHICCGAGGSYMLTHPDNAGQLRALKQQIITDSSADLVVSGNFGCGVYLNADGGSVEHPLLLLARQLPFM